MAERLRNITITLDERTAAWLRNQAAKRGLSVSRLVGELLRDRMGEMREYNEAMRRFLSRKPVMLKSAGERYPTRAELYDRSNLR